MIDDKPTARWYLVECYSRDSGNGYRVVSVPMLAYSAEDAIAQHNVRIEGISHYCTKARSVAPLVEDGDKCEDCQRFTVRHCDPNDARSAIYCTICKRIPRRVEPVEPAKPRGVVCFNHGEHSQLLANGYGWCEECGAYNEPGAVTWKLPKSLRKE